MAGRFGLVIDRDRMTDTFIDLVRLPSESRRERPVADYLVRALTEIGADVRIDDAGAAVGGDCGNVLARMPGTADLAPLLLSAHMDTVPPGCGVSPIRETSRIRSDGSTVLGGDDKSGVAIILEILRTVRERGPVHGDLEIAFTICEEVGLLGARHLDIGALAAKRAIVLDSADADELTTKSPASDHFEFVVRGLEAHAGIAPENGISAVRVAAEAIAAMPLGRIDACTTANVVIAECSQATNVIPNRVVVRGEARSLDDARLAETIAAIRRCFQDAASRAVATVDGRIHRAWLEERVERHYERLNVPDDAEIVRMLQAAARRVGRTVMPSTGGGGSDANVFNERGIEAVNLGTGMRDIHTVNEWLDLDDFYACADIVLAAVTENGAA